MHQPESLAREIMWMPKGTKMTDPQPDKEVLDAVLGRLCSTRASLRSTEAQITANLITITRQVKTQAELRDRITVLEDYLKEHNVDPSEVEK